MNLSVNGNHSHPLSRRHFRVNQEELNRKEREGKEKNSQEQESIFVTWFCTLDFRNSKIFFMNPTL
jgi:hypothetical protein